MKQIQADIVEFMRAAKQDVPAYPTIPPLEVRVLRAKLIIEEALEQCEALGVQVAIDTVPVSNDELEYFDGGLVDLVKFADGCCDQVYVSVGGACALGLNLTEPWFLVQQANIAKFGPGSYLRPDGKVMKPPGWIPPDEDIRTALKEQAYVGNEL